MQGGDMQDIIIFIYLGIIIGCGIGLGFIVGYFIL